jgi:Uma2 family endonuclease
VRRKLHRVRAEALVAPRVTGAFLTSTRREGPADFIIEIASENGPGLDRREKLPRYREAGIEEMSFVDWFDKVVRVARKGSAGYTSTTLASWRLDSRVVPGFWIEVSWLSRDPLPPTLGCLREILGSI